MAVIINTAMERVVCVASDVFWRVKSVEILTHILRTFASKWATWMHFVIIVAMDCHVYKLGGHKVDKSWMKGRHTIDGIFSTLTDNRDIILPRLLLHVHFFMLKKLQNDIEVNTINR